ncbi:hypothetical protein DFH09DRAFT_1121220 [Mycena vulgaris]|nr:hypothetical protein DFH09DRAFT_1121220 [Mycena vulgaris]
MGAGDAPRSRTLDARAAEKERAREEARRARLRCAPPPPPPLPLTHTHTHPAAYFPFQVQPGRWGVQSARTSPARGAGEREREREWAQVTPPRVALPRFADLERWSVRGMGVGAGAGAGQVTLGEHLQRHAAAQQQHASQSQQPSQSQHAQTQARTTHQPRRAVFANAGPPGVSGYAYAY